MGNLTNSYATTPVSEYDASKVATYNDLAQILDSAINGRLAISTTGGTTTLTGTPAAPQAQNLFLDVSGTLTSNSIIEIPIAAGTGRNRIYVVKNGTSGAYTLTVKKVGGTGVTVTQGSTAILLYNGTDIQYATAQVVSSTGLIGTSALPATIWARAYHNANQSIATATNTVLALNSERNDTDTIHDTSTNNSRLTCKTAGVYSIVGGVAWDANATGVRSVKILLNGATVIGQALMAGFTVSSLGNMMQVASVYALAVNDYVELQVYQDSGVSLNVVAGSNYSPEFMMSRLGA